MSENPCVVLPDGRSVPCTAGSTLLDVLSGAGVELCCPCNGNHRCGKCLVHASGELSVPDAHELDLLGARRHEKDLRVACMAEVRGPVCLIDVVSMPQTEGAQLLADTPVPISCRCVARAGLGVAFDIGTTTVAGALVDLQTGKRIGTTARLNSQRRFGADVLTRIAWEGEDFTRHRDILQDAVCSLLDEMIAALCEDAKASPAEVREIAVAANCAMTHMLLGADARGLGVSPYTPAFEGVQRREAASLGLRSVSKAQVICLPHVSAYIGADIVAGAYVCELGAPGKAALFADIGTNGEIVLAHDGALTCCSCAAGPALEGMDIRFGMSAGKGAVEDVRIDAGRVTLSVIGGGPALGFCGSGILSAVSELVRTHAVDARGTFVKPDELPEDDPRRAYIAMDGKKRVFRADGEDGVVVTQGDVRQMQLAKGAIRSGMETLLSCTNLSWSQLDDVFIAGQFGAHLAPELLVGVGLLVPEAAERVRYVGNTSMAGAMMVLLDPHVAESLHSLAQRMDCIELATRPGYDRLFAKCSRFA